MKNLLYVALLLWGSLLCAQDTAIWLIPLEKYENIIPWNQYFLINDHGRWGMLDQKLKPVLPSKYERIEAMCEWAVAVKENGKWGFRHRKDLRKWAVQPIYEDWGWGPGSKRNRGYAHSWILHVGKKEWAITIYKEKIVVEEPDKRALSVEVLGDGDEVVSKTPPAKAPPTFIAQPWHSQWKTVEPMYDIYDEDKINPSNDVFDVVDQGEKHGMTDAQGNILIPVRFDKLRIISSQTIVAGEGIEYGKPSYYTFFRRSDGKQVSKETYNGYDRSLLGTDVNIKVYQLPSSQINFLHWGLLNPGGEELIPCLYAAFAEVLPPGFTPAKLYGRWGVVNTKNKVLLPFNYDDIRVLGQGNSLFLLVSKGRETGLLGIK
ncbi:MAG: WG repeat-containing protein [Saprospiraceae bacterium]|nr:WG repeat-containing protein [Saprospiraceae bacterium]